MTPRKLITASLRLVGAVHKSEALAADEAADGLDRLNDILSSWSNDGLLCYARTWENFSLVAGTGNYTIGQGQTFNAQRPSQIVSAYTRQDTTDTPVTVITDEAYVSIPVKSTQGTPTSLSLDNAYPYAIIRLYPVPSQALTLFLLTEKPIASFPSLDVDIGLPPGWERALRYKLAFDLAPEYGMSIPLDVRRDGDDAIGDLRMASVRSRPLVFDTARTLYDGYTDTYV